MFKNRKKKEIFIAVLRVFIVIFGSFCVSFGAVAFFSPLDINSGGLNGIAIIIRSFFDPELGVIIYNIATAALSVFFWVLGLIFIGKEFAIKTLVATIAYPIGNFLFTLCPGISDLVNNLATIASGAKDAGSYLLCGIFGGVFVGFGVAITFVGGGSTGGVDVLTFMANKYLHIKQSTASFIVDGSIVVIGLCVLLPKDSSNFLPCASGIISAFVCAFLIDYIYVGFQSSYQADIISDKWEEISNFAQVELERGTTIIRAEGGYKGEERLVLRIVFDKRQYSKLRDFIAKTDKKAFVTYTRTNAVFGEGFTSHEQSTLFKNVKKHGKK